MHDYVYYYYIAAIFATALLIDLVSWDIYCIYCF